MRSMWLAMFALASTCAQAKDDPIILAPHEKVLVLPAEFAYFKFSASGVELAAEKTERARQNVVGSVQRALQREPPVEFVALPELGADEQRVLREHRDLLWLSAMSAVDSLANKTVPWRDRKNWRIDYSIGPGLEFLAARSGAQKAMLVSGLRMEPDAATALSIGMGLLRGWLPGGRVNVRNFSATVIDLRSGDILAVYSPVRGLDGEPADRVGANTWIHALLGDFPGHPVSEPPLNQPPARKYERHARAGFALMPPMGWRLTVSGKSCFRRHENTLESFCIDARGLGKAMHEQGLGPDTDPLQLAEAAMKLLKADTNELDMDVTAVTRTKVAGRDGFEAELTSRRGLTEQPLRVRHRVYGVASPDGAWLLQYSAPAIYYYERHLPEIESAVATLQLY